MKFEELEPGSLFMYDSKIYLKVKPVSVPFGGIGDTMLVNAHSVGTAEGAKWAYVEPGVIVYEVSKGRMETQGR